MEGRIQTSSLLSVGPVWTLICARSKFPSHRKPSGCVAPSPRPFGSRVAVGGAGWDPPAAHLLVPEMMYRPGGILSEVHVPCCCLRGICSAILGSKISLEANRCHLCVNKYNTILREFGYKEMLLCMKLSTRHLSSSKLRFFFFKRRCIITGKIFYFFIFYHSTYMMAKDMPGKVLFGKFVYFLLHPQLAKAPNSLLSNFFLFFSSSSS